MFVALFKFYRFVAIFLPASAVSRFLRGSYQRSAACRSLQISLQDHSLQEISLY